MSDESAGPVAGDADDGSGWEGFQASAPALAAAVAGQLRASPAYLATVDAQGRPRVHPVTPIIGDGHLLLFMEPTSPKGLDLRERRGYALHNGVPDSAGTGGECFLRGTGSFVDDPAMRAVATKAAGYTPEDRYVLFELLIESVTATKYEDDGPTRDRWSRP